MDGVSVRLNKDASCVESTSFSNGLVLGCIAADGDLLLLCAVEHGAHGDAILFHGVLQAALLWS